MTAPEVAFRVTGWSTRCSEIAAAEAQHVSTPVRTGGGLSGGRCLHRREDASATGLGKGGSHEHAECFRKHEERFFIVENRVQRAAAALCIAPPTINRTEIPKCPLAFLMSCLYSTPRSPVRWYFSHECAFPCEGFQAPDVVRRNPMC